MKENKIKVLRLVAGFLAFFFGGMAVVAGSRVLFGVDVPQHVTHSWLLVYNVVAGGLSLITAFGIWLKKDWALTLIKLILGAHVIVFCIVGGIALTSGNVASKSVAVMLVRSVVWGIIWSFYAYSTEENPKT